VPAPAPTPSAAPSDRLRTDAVPLRRRPAFVLGLAFWFLLAGWCVWTAYRTQDMQGRASTAVAWLRQSESVRAGLGVLTSAHLGVEEPADEHCRKASERMLADDSFAAEAPTAGPEAEESRDAWRAATARFREAIAAAAAAAAGSPALEEARRRVMTAHIAVDDAVTGMRAAVSDDLTELNRRLVAGWNSLWAAAAVALVTLATLIRRLAVEARRRDELRASQAALVESERRFREMADDAPVVMWLEDDSGRNTFVNRRWFELTGRPPRRTVDFYEDVHPDDVDRVRRTYADARSRRAAVDVEYRLRTADGAERWMFDRAAPRFDAEGEFLGFHGVAFDVTERREHERRAAEDKRHEAVGRLAGGVAHDFNNFLTVILGCADDLERSAGGAADIRRTAEDIRRAAELAASLTGRLLTFTRQDVESPTRIDLRRALDEFEPLLRRLIGEDVRLEVRCAPGVGAVALDPGRLTQIVVNLAANARQAMPRGGRLAIEARPSPENPAYALLAFEDDGAGMTPDVRARLFEPFFTTSASPKNVGLGLATVDAVVRQVGGTIAVTSAPGAGSRFEILLPRVGAATPPAEFAAAEPPATTDAAPPGPPPLVMVVEDDDAIRGLARRYLADAGYEIHDAADAASALALAGRLPREPQALFTDVVMPGGSGGPLADALRARFPRLRVVFMSGYTDDDVVRHGVSRAESAFLPKPFTRRQIVAKAREVFAA
jgi:two-component system cell cycle sensor histidine kinase/response regulator CckA